MRRFDIKRILGTIIGVVLVVAVLAITDGNTKKDLLGTWSYSYTIEYDEDLDVELTEFFELTDGKYRWYMDRDVTKTALLKAYDDYIKEQQITEEDIIKAGYESIDDCKQQWLETDLKDIVDDYNESEGGTGTWDINQGDFTFIEDGTAAESITNYRLEGDKLYLQTDGIVLTRVK